jgi:hypothetical protein
MLKKIVIRDARCAIRDVNPLIYIQGLKSRITKHVSRILHHVSRITHPVSRIKQQRVYFGDTHHHSSYSFDCGMIGNILDPEVSFRFARGEEIHSSTGLRVQLNRPLDFLVVSDHAEYLGLAELINTANPEFLAVEAGRELYDAVKQGGDVGWSAVMDIMRDMQAGNPRIDLSKVKRPVWEQVVDIASKYNQPGVFTAFNGYEYSPLPNGNNLHRVVIYRDGPDRVKQLIPFSAFDSQDPEDLWAFMAGYAASCSRRPSMVRP